MRYTIICRCNELKPRGIRLFRVRALRPVLTIVRGVSAVICYLGVFLSIPIVEFVPFNLLKWLHVRPTDTLYRICEIIVLCLVFALGVMSIAATVRHLKVARIDVDGIVLSAGSVTGFFLGLWILPKGL